MEVILGNEKFFLNYFYIKLIIIRVSSLQLNKWYFLFIVVWNNIIIILITILKWKKFTLDQYKTFFHVHEN